MSSISKVRQKDTSNIRLISRIIERIRAEGPITFAEFMEFALYDKEDGYYISPSNSGIGWEGDYITTPLIHPFFGRAVAKQAIEMFGILGSENPCIVELGGSSGLLASHVVSAIEELSPELSQRLGYIIIEKVAFKKTLYRDTFSGMERISWRSDVEGLKDMGDGIVFISNEFFDALPFHRLKVLRGSLKEVYVEYDDEIGFYDLPGPVSSGDLSKHISNLDIELFDDMELEVNMEALRYMRTIGGIIERGFVITIDYGYPSMELYSRRHPKGTMLCYSRHRTEKDPYVRIGYQDITAHVDFTSLSIEGMEQGLEVTGFTDQGSFLIGLGILDEISSLGDDQIEDRMAARNLFMPGGFGDTFKVLIQHKGVECDTVSGLKWKDRRDRLFPKGMNKR